MALTRDFRETVQARVKRDAASEKGLLATSSKTFCLARCQSAKSDCVITSATVGFPKLAAHTKIHVKTLHQMFGPTGNPTARNPFEIVAYLRKRGRCALLSFILVPNRGERIKINAWNWRPTMEFLRVEGVIDDETSELMTCNLGTKADADPAARMAAAVERKLRSMQPGERIRADLSVTSASKKIAEFHKSETIDPVDLYSATYEWLVEFKNFCERCGGFEVS